MNYFEDSIVVVRCPKCGAEARCQTGVVLTTYPTKYSVYCPVCKEVHYIYCSELQNYKIG